MRSWAAIHGGLGVQSFLGMTLSPGGKIRAEKIQILVETQSGSLGPLEHIGREGLECADLHVIYTASHILNQRTPETSGSP